MHHEWRGVISHVCCQNIDTIKTEVLAKLYNTKKDLFELALCMCLSVGESFFGNFWQHFGKFKTIVINS